MPALLRRRSLALPLCFLALAACAPQPWPNRAQGLPADPQGLPSLKAIYARDFLIGTAVDFYRPGAFSPAELALLRSQFNALTPENSMKPASIHPTPDRWNFRTPDALAQFCHDNNITLIGHTLVWHHQTPDWFFENPDKSLLPRAEALARLQNHISTLVTHYKGKVKGWDVVNEAIDDAPLPGENLRDSRWLRTVGPDYLTYAYRFAHEADPHAELYYNDYNIESGPKHKSSLLLLQRLLREGAPITAVGIQGHWSLDFLPLDDLDHAIADYRRLGLKVMITELDIGISGPAGGQLAPTSQPASRPTTTSAPAPAPAPLLAPGDRVTDPNAVATPAQLEAQAQAYQRLFRILHKHRDTITRVTFWGLNDRRTWRQGKNPLLFDRTNTPKPAFFATATAHDWWR